jgi:hypothetical protein
MSTGSISFCVLVAAAVPKIHGNRDRSFYGFLAS